MKLCMEIGLGPGHTELDGEPCSSSQKGTAPSFRHMSVEAKRLDGLIPLGMKVASAQATLC